MHSDSDAKPGMESEHLIDQLSGSSVNHEEKDEETTKLLNLWQFPHVWQKIFLYLDDFDDLLMLRLIDRTWREFINQYILRSPQMKKTFVHHYLVHPWLSNSLESLFVKKIPFNCSFLRLRAEGDFCIVEKHIMVRNSRVIKFGIHLRNCHLHTITWKGSTVEGVHGLEFMSCGRVLLAIKFKHCQVSVRRFQATYDHHKQQFTMENAQSLREHPLFLNVLKILTLHKVANDVLVLSLHFVVEKEHQVMLTSLQFGWQKNVTESVKPDWINSTWKFWVFDNNGTLVHVPNACLSRMGRWNDFDSFVSLNACRQFRRLTESSALTDHFVCLPRQDQNFKGSPWIIQATHLTDGTTFCSSPRFRHGPIKIASSQDFAAYACHRNPFVCVFCDKNQSWVSISHPDRVGDSCYMVRSGKIIGNILIIICHDFQDRRHLISVFNLEKGGEVLRTLIQQATMGHMYGAITTDGFYAVQGVTGKQRLLMIQLTNPDQPKMFEQE